MLSDLDGGELEPCARLPIRDGAFGLGDRDLPGGGEGGRGAIAAGSIGDSLDCACADWYWANSDLNWIPGWSAAITLDFDRLWTGSSKEEGSRGRQRCAGSWGWLG